MPYGTIIGATWLKYTAVSVIFQKYSQWINGHGKQACPPSLPDIRQAGLGQGLLCYARNDRKNVVSMKPCSKTSASSVESLQGITKLKEGINYYAYQPEQIFTIEV